MSLPQTCFTASLILYPRPLKITANLVFSPLGQKYTLREQDLLLAPGYPNLVLFSELPGLTNSYVFIASSENGRGLCSTLSLWCSINLPRLAHFWMRRFSHCWVPLLKCLMIEFIWHLLISLDSTQLQMVPFDEIFFVAVTDGSSSCQW